MKRLNHKGRSDGAGKVRTRLTSFPNPLEMNYLRFLRLVNRFMANCPGAEAPARASTTGELRLQRRDVRRPQEVKRDTNSPALIRPLADRRYSKIISQTWNPYAQHYK
jgi:hypothetical protein